MAVPERAAAGSDGEAEEHADNAWHMGQDESEGKGNIPAHIRSFRAERSLAGKIWHSLSSWMKHMILLSPQSTLLDL